MLGSLLVLSSVHLCFSFQKTSCLSKENNTLVTGMSKVVWVQCHQL